MTPGRVPRVPQGHKVARGDMGDTGVTQDVMESLWGHTGGTGGIPQVPHGHKVVQG